jgi:hypothetical protein
MADSNVPGLAASVPASQQAKLEMLKAGAVAGQAGMNEYATAKNDINSAQQQALAAAAGRADALNAPSTFIAKQNAAVSLPGNTAIPQLNALQQAQTAYLGQLQNANKNYLGGVGQSQTLLQNIAGKQLQGVQGKAYGDALSKALTVQSQLQSLQDKQATSQKKLSESQIQQAQLQNYQDLNNDQSRYSEATRQAAQHILNTSGSYDQALKQVTTTKDEKGKSIDLSPDQWAGNGVNMQDLLDIIGIQYDAKNWFAKHPNAQAYMSPVGTPGGADYASPNNLG